MLQEDVHLPVYIQPLHLQGVVYDLPFALFGDLQPAFSRSPYRQHGQVYVRREAPVEPPLGFDELPALFEGGKIQKGKAHRFLDLESKSPGQKDP